MSSTKDEQIFEDTEDRAQRTLFVNKSKHTDGPKLDETSRYVLKTLQIPFSDPADMVPPPPLKEGSQKNNSKSPAGRSEGKHL